ncbi:MAG: hypothetical protein M1830_001667 [Pleopsidium flavum]|nr:MAG: hypothetical protein M1830_001667 [Pleopsidium flavum]
MSTPTRQLQQLQIQGRMPTTRSQAQREQRQQARELHESRGTEQESGLDESGPSGGEASPPSVSPASSPEDRIIRGSSGIAYDSRQLSPASRSRAIEGMNAEVDVGQSREINGYYAFEIPERASVRIGPPEGPYATPTCSCTDFQNRESACRHIYWLLDHMRLAQPFPATSPPVLARDGSVQHAPSPYEYIAGHGLDELTKRLGWPLRQTDPPSFEVRKDRVRDMLSVFDSTGALPEEYRMDVFASITDTPLSLQECYVPHELERTLVNLAMNDDAVYRGLQEVVPPNRCALAYIGKLRSRAQTTINKLEEYVSDGPSDGDQSPTDVAWCAEHLRSIVFQTSGCLNSHAPLPTDVLTRAAAFLVELLQHICTRNDDVYEDIDWDREAPENEGEANRNLYVRLIGNPPHSLDESTVKQENFVIDTLRDFPPASISQFTERLEGILETVEANGATETYMEALGQLIQRLEGAAASSVSGQKRRRVR